MLRRNLYFAPISVKTKAYMSCVRPIVEYAASCWSPTSDKMINRLEMLQHNAAKFATNKYPRKGHYNEFSISDILRDLNWESLEERRKQLRLNMTFKILNDNVILSSDNLPRTEHNRPLRACSEVPVGAENELIEPHARTVAVSETFFYKAPKLWNEFVTPLQAKAPSIEAFKQHFVKK